MEYETYLHEIKNPLNVIFGLAQVLKVASKKEVKQYADMIVSSVKQIKAIDADFRIYRNTGKTDIKYSVVDVRTMLKEIVVEQQPLADEYKVSFVTEFSRAIAFTDTSKLRQAITNAISNAIKYNIKNGLVSVKCYTMGSDIHMDITDTGIGMSKKELELIGTAFYRSKKIDRPGTGLGICIMIKLAKLLNWDLEIDSNIDQGTTFHFVLHHVTGYSSSNRN
jgi:signal transduction histidine kinase